MSEDLKVDDLARLIALERAFGTITLLWAGMFAEHAKSKPSIAVEQLSSTMLGSAFDNVGHSDQAEQRVNYHLRKLLSQVMEMAKHADQGYP